MSSQSNAPAPDPVGVLRTSVAGPAFFAKLASFGHASFDKEAAERALAVSDAVAAAVDSVAGAIEEHRGSAGVKRAVDATLGAVQPAPAYAAADFLAIPGVKEAAAAVLLNAAPAEGGK